MYIYLIGTFCIVNVHISCHYISLIFNLIGTFCIVNFRKILDILKYKLDLIGTFCIVNTFSVTHCNNIFFI